MEKDNLVFEMQDDLESQTLKENRVKYDMDALIDWLNSNWKNPPCPICHGEDWRIEKQLFVTAKSVSSIHTNGSGIYIIPVSCSNCAFMMFINKRIVMEQMLSEGVQ